MTITAPAALPAHHLSSELVGSETQPAVPCPRSTWKKIADPRPGVRDSL